METYVPRAETWYFQEPLWPALLVGMRRKMAFLSVGSHCKMCHVLSMLLVPYHCPSSSFLLLWHGENISFQSQRALKNEFLLLSENSPDSVGDGGFHGSVIQKTRSSQGCGGMGDAAKVGCCASLDLQAAKG